MTTAYLIINGKKAGIPEIREAVDYLRGQGHNLQVRVTWEYGDGFRYVKEAAEKGAERVIAGGGDGTVNEISHGLIQLSDDERPVMAILPLGTANDFATCCTIPTEPLAALSLALEGNPTTGEVGKENPASLMVTSSACSPTSLKQGPQRKH